MAESDLKAYPEHFDVDFSSLENLMTLKKRHNEMYLEMIDLYQKFLNDSDKTFHGRLFVELYKQVGELKEQVQKATEEVDGDENLRLITNMMRRDGDEFIEQEQQENVKNDEAELKEQIMIDDEVRKNK